MSGELLGRLGVVAGGSASVIGKDENPMSYVCWSMSWSEGYGRLEGGRRPSGWRGGPMAPRLAVLLHPPPQGPQT